MRAYFNFAALIADKLSEVKGDVRRDGYFACGGNATDCKCHSIRGTIGTVHKLLFGKFQKVTAMTLSAKTLIPTALTALAAVALPASAADAKPRTFMDMAYGSAAMSGDQVCRETLHDLQLVDHSGDGESNTTCTYRADSGLTLKADITSAQDQSLQSQFDRVSHIPGEEMKADSLLCETNLSMIIAMNKRSGGEITDGDLPLDDLQRCKVSRSDDALTLVSLQDLDGTRIKVEVTAPVGEKALDDMINHSAWFHASQMSDDLLNMILPPVTNQTA
ncbi:MAG: hypothetical protein CMK06_10050 [Ponticaulis sp.]|nr:hypothetical protein [Ponticaulis sp.]